MSEKKYIGTYKVVKIGRKSGKRTVLHRDKTQEDAQRLTNSYPDSNRSMVVYFKQFYADKYFV